MFVVDILHGPIVIARGDCGVGFKYSALMGEVIADLAEVRPDEDIATRGLARFADGDSPRSGPSVLGRH